ncbi:MAG: uncharacterized protein JWR35_562 [Marmoricola sp.]|nr:uncharacterized protein [Marmoricola sp.]
MKARDSDRDAAISLVKQACVNGQIIEADRDKRTEQIRGAHSLAEIDMLTNDLKAAAAPPPSPVAAAAPVVGATSTIPEPSSAPTVEQSAPFQKFTPPATKMSGPMGLRGIFTLVAAAAIALAIGGVSLFAAHGGGSTASGGSGDPGSITVEQPEKVDPLTVAGFNQMRSAIIDKTGSSKAFSLSVYPGYGIVEVPIDATTKHEQRFYWNGQFQDQGTGSSSYRLIDLNAIDPAVLVRLSNRARTTLVKEPTSWYVLAYLADNPTNDKTVLWAYANNKFNEGGYISATIDGKVTRKVTW